MGKYLKLKKLLRFWPICPGTRVLATPWSFIPRIFLKNSSLVQARVDYVKNRPECRFNLCIIF